jgi:hypothetical protein
MYGDLEFSTGLLAWACLSPTTHANDIRIGSFFADTFFVFPPLPFTPPEHLVEKHNKHLTHVGRFGGGGGGGGRSMTPVRLQSMTRATHSLWLGGARGTVVHTGCTREAHACHALGHAHACVVLLFVFWCQVAPNLTPCQAEAEPFHTKTQKMLLQEILSA